MYVMVAFQFHQQAETNTACLLLETTNFTFSFDLSYLFTTSTNKFGLFGGADRASLLIFFIKSVQSLPQQNEESF
jgi:hypothetical protein